VIARWAILAVAATLPTVAAVAYFVGADTGALGDGSPVGPNLLFQATYFGAKVVEFFLPVLWFGLWGGLPLAAWRPTPRGLPLGLGFGGIVSLAILAGFFGFLRHQHHLMQHTPEQVRAKLSGLGCDQPATFLALAVFLSVAHALLEEYYWRWFLFGELRRRIPHGWANFLGGLAFMSHHVVILAVYFPGRFWLLAAPLSLGVAIGGWFWNWLYDRTGSVYPGWVGHVLIDAAIMVAGYDLMFGGR
jgi:membrane protease YdiL (CAAX protease family)